MRRRIGVTLDKIRHVSGKGKAMLRHLVPSEHLKLLEDTVEKVNKESDEQLLAQIKRGNQSALSTIVERHQGRIYQFALLMTGSVGVAEDVTIGVFLNVTRNLHKFTETRAPLEYLLLRKSCESVRRLGEILDEDVSLSERENLIPDRNDGAADEINRATRISMVQRAVLKLPVFYREVLVLCEIQGVKHAQVAQLLSCRVQDLRSRLRRARSLLLGELAALRLKSLQLESSRALLDRGVPVNA